MSAGIFLIVSGGRLCPGRTATCDIVDDRERAAYGAVATANLS